ncbi:hypothetical protein Cgig2_013531 [Carnegiea gigantea]|uniref:Uncharacterized protein n=1 Tax=Carnegiea gigantea TaxID=171969 RepID=A0A9Q1GQD9_9CARY|nr:hypothetical protein Cgig2_013531 [Carnegiea gigantea]
MERESKFVVDPEKARQALKELDQQLGILSRKQVNPPKIRASSLNSNLKEQMKAESPEISGSFLAFTAFSLFAFTIFYNILFLTVIKPSMDYSCTAYLKMQYLTSLSTAYVTDRHGLTVAWEERGNGIQEGVGKGGQSMGLETTRKGGRGQSKGDYKLPRSIRGILKANQISASKFKAHLMSLHQSSKEEKESRGCRRGMTKGKGSGERLSMDNSKRDDRDEEGPVQKAIYMNVVHPMETHDSKTIDANMGAMVGGKELDDDHNRRILPATEATH